MCLECIFNLYISRDTEYGLHYNHCCDLQTISEWTDRNVYFVSKLDRYQTYANTSDRFGLRTILLAKLTQISINWDEKRIMR